MFWNVLSVVTAIPVASLWYVAPSSELISTVNPIVEVNSWLSEYFLYYMLETSISPDWFDEVMAMLSCAHANP